MRVFERVTFKRAWNTYYVINVRRRVEVLQSIYALASSASLWEFGAAKLLTQFGFPLRLFVIVMSIV
jgi:hypothetical protein